MSTTVPHLKMGGRKREGASKTTNQAKENKYQVLQERLKKKHQCVDTHLLCASTYISESEAFCQYANYDVNEDKLRLSKIFDLCLKIHLYRPQNFQFL